MKARTLITIILLAFVAISAGYLIFKETRDAPGEKKNGAGGGTAAAAKQKPGPENQAGKPGTAWRLIVYYFHGDMRCQSCLRIEAYTREALEQSFAKEIQDGLIEWRVINVDETGNEHYWKDYKLYTKSVIVAEMKGDKQVRWKNLDKIWELLDDKQTFLAYITDQVRPWLAGVP